MGYGSAPLEDVPHLDVSHFTIESEFGSSSDEEDALAKMANGLAEHASEASHDTTTSGASLWSKRPWSGLTLENFDKTCERLDNKFLEKLDSCTTAASIYADMCAETLDNWKAAAESRVDNLKLMEKYDAFDENLGRKVSDTVDVFGQSVTMGVAQIGQKVGDSVDQAKRSTAFQVATQHKDRAQHLFDTGTKQLRAS